MLRCRLVKFLVRLWLILAPAYLVTTLAICWIVSGSVVYPTETVAHVLIIPLLQAALLAVLFRKREDPRKS